MKFSFIGNGVRAFYREYRQTILDFISEKREFESTDGLQIGCYANVMAVADLIIKKTLKLPSPPTSIRRYIVPQ